MIKLQQKKARPSIKIEIAKFQDGYYYVVGGVKQTKVSEEDFKLLGVEPQVLLVTVTQGKIEYDHKTSEITFELDKQAELLCQPPNILDN